MMDALQVIQSNTANISTGSMVSLSGQGMGQNESNTVGGANRSFFETYLLDAVTYVNDKQQASTDIAQQFIIDPDSIDVHDVTIAMAEANLSLSLAQNVINRLTQAWSEITTTR